MIFAAGLGTRLKPLTDTMPKAMVPVNGKPLIQILLERLQSAGADKVVVNVHHFAQQIKDFVASHKFGGMDIAISDESDQLLETGGGIKKALPLFDNGNDEPILIHNVDILHNVDLQKFYSEASEMCRQKEMGAMLMVSKRSTSRYLLFDDENRLVGWTNISTGEVKSPYKNLDVSKCRMFAFSGIHIITPALTPFFGEWQGKFAIIDFYLSVCNRIAIYANVNEDLQLIDVGKLDTLAKAEDFLKQQKTGV